MSDGKSTRQIEQRALEYIMEYGLGPHFGASSISGDITREQWHMLQSPFNPYRDEKHENLRTYVWEMSRLVEPHERDNAD